MGVSVRFRTLDAVRDASEDFVSLCVRKSSLAWGKRTRQQKRTLAPSSSEPSG
jgi:hypothetical protein